MTGSEQPTDAWLEAYPEDGWLRGYFFDREIDVKTAGSVVGIRKNHDFLRLKDFSLHLLQPGPGKRILDVGCADGATMVYCGLQGATVAGQDLDPERVQVANATLSKYGIDGEARAGDAQDLVFADNSFDGVIANDFFEHIADETKIRVLAEMLRVLKPGAPAVIRTPNLSYLRLALWYKRVRAVLKLQNPFQYVIPHTPGTENPEHIGLATRASLTRCLLAGGFANYEFRYAPLRRFGNSMTMEMFSTEVPGVRDLLSEDLVCIAYKPITLSHFPD